MLKPPRKYMRVCSLHFQKDDFILPVPTKRPRLKATVVPSQHLPEKNIINRVTQYRKFRKQTATVSGLNLTASPCQHQDALQEPTQDNYGEPIRILSETEQEAVLSLLVCV